MITYQDLLKAGKSEKDRVDFVRRVIDDHMSSDLYRTAVKAYKYFDAENVTIMNYQKTIVTITGKVIPDEYCANHKIASGYFERFVTQQNQYLLGNGVTWKKPEKTNGKLGEAFDDDLQDAGENALIGAVSFGFWNYDHMDVFKVTEFAPLWDEENGSLRSGVRWWQIDASKPMRATLYEEDGYTDYIWDGKDSEGRELNPKRKYIDVYVESGIDGMQIMDGENYPSFPIVPCWSSKRHKSPFKKIVAGIDAYDFIKNGFTNDFDDAQLYWIIKGAAGMDDPDLAQFLQRLKNVRAAAPADGQEVEAVTVDIPFEAREKILDRIDADLYSDFMALDFKNIINGAATATQIRAAYEALNAKTDKYEYCITKFVKAVLNLAGVEDFPTYTRSMVVNVQEEVQTIIMAAEFLPREYVTTKILTIYGDKDLVPEVLKQMASDEVERGKAVVASEEDGDGGDGQGEDGVDE